MNVLVRLHGAARAWFLVCFLTACGSSSPPPTTDLGAETPTEADAAGDTFVPATDTFVPMPDVMDARISPAPDVSGRDVSLDTSADDHPAAADGARDTATEVIDASVLMDVPRDTATDTYDAVADVRDVTAPPTDTGVDVARDTGVVAPTDGGCPAPTPPPRTDPCPGSTDCGLSTHGRVRFTGARTTARELQVRVELPASVRVATGAACDRLVFRTTTGAWAPHWVQDCAAGILWVRVPQIDATGTDLAMHYGAGTTAPAANSYDDTFDRIPLSAPSLLGAWTFDEGSGTRACPAAGTAFFNAWIDAAPYDAPHPELSSRPPLWTTNVPASPLGGRFTRGNRALDFPRSQVIVNPSRPTVTRPGRLVNWRTPDSASLRASAAITVGAWVYTATPANEFEDNWQTVISYGMPADPTPPFPGADVSMLGNFNPWAIFFQGVNPAETVLMTNTCAYPCLEDDEYAHIATRDPLPREALVGAWHFVAMTVDTTTPPHTTRRAFYDARVFEYPRVMVTWPPEMFCPGGTCRAPPDGRIQYYDAPVILGGDMNNGEVALGLEGRLDDVFILGRAASVGELAAWRERRQYSADPISATVTP